MTNIVRTIDRLCALAAGLAAALFFFIGLIVTYEVVMRYVFLNPTRWVEESSRVLQIYAVFLACAWLVGRRDHIRITVVTGWLKTSIQLWLARLSLLLVAVVSGVGAWYSGSLMRFSISIGQRTDSTLELPMWLLQAPLVVGLTLAALQALAVAADSFNHPERLSGTARVRDT